MLALVALAAPQEPTYTGIEVRIDGEPVKFTRMAPVLKGSRVQVPMREVFQQLGAEVTYYPDEKLIDVRKGSLAVRLAVGQEIATKTGNERIVLQEAPRIVNDTVYVPLRFVGEAMGAKVEWNEAESRVDITRPEEVLTPDSA